MIQRIQSLYLSVVPLCMAVFLQATLWENIALGSLFTITLKSHALIIIPGDSAMCPYGLVALLSYALIVLASYAIIRHDNRSLQLRLINWVNLILLLLVGLVVILVKKVEASYPLDGSGSYKIATLLPFIASMASLLARGHIKKDDRLVSEDRLR